MLRNEVTSTPGQNDRLYSSPALGFVASVFGVLACACGFVWLMPYYFGDCSPIARIVAVPLLIAGIACAGVYLVRFRGEFMSHRAMGSSCTTKVQECEIKVTAWAVVTACVGLSLSVLTFTWVIF